MRDLTDCERAVLSVLSAGPGRVETQAVLEAMRGCSPPWCDAEVTRALAGLTGKGRLIALSTSLGAGGRGPHAYLLADTNHAGPTAHYASPRHVAGGGKGGSGQLPPGRPSSTLTPSPLTEIVPMTRLLSLHQPDARTNGRHHGEALPFRLALRAAAFRTLAELTEPPGRAVSVRAYDPDLGLTLALTASPGAADDATPDSKPAGVLPSFAFTAHELRILATAAKEPGATAKKLAREAGLTHHDRTPTTKYKILAARLVEVGALVPHAAGYAVSADVLPLLPLAVESPPEPAADSPAMAPFLLSPLEVRILRTIGSGALKGGAVAARLDMTDGVGGAKSRLREALARLVDVNILEVVAETGYRVTAGAAPLMPTALAHHDEDDEVNDKAPKPCRTVGPEPTVPPTDEPAEPLLPFEDETGPDEPPADLVAAIVTALVEEGVPLGPLAVSAALRVRGVSRGGDDLAAALDWLEDAGRVQWVDGPDGKGFVVAGGTEGVSPPVQSACGAEV